MNKLRIILNDILTVSESDIKNDEKHKQLASLWTEYYKLANNLKVDLPDINILAMTLKNNSFIIKQDTIQKEINDETLESFDILKNALDNNLGVNEKHVFNILNWTVDNTLKNLDSFLNIMDVNVWSDNLDGYCKISQGISLIPLENFGLKVTKNKATDCFGYPFTHAFGTVTFPVIEGSNIIDKTYLIDVTYRQFLSTVYCHEGMYYSTTERQAPDVGYFVEEKFAKELLANGYVELNEKTAELYGLPFFKAGLNLQNKNKSCDIDFYKNIIKKSSDYVAKDYELEDFDLSIPVYKNKSY